MQTTMKVKLFIFGATRTIYPACPVSRQFVLLLRQKTLTNQDLEHIKALGFKVQVETVDNSD